MNRVHEHRFELFMHLDGCHEVRSSFRCACGTTRLVKTERDFHNEDTPLARAFYREDCERCRDLMAGAEPKHHAYGSTAA